MKAVALTRYGMPEDLELKDLPVPEPGPGEVLVKVRAAAVNDWDWNMVRGTPFYIRLFCGLRAHKVPIRGVDVAGEVAALGEGATRFRPGDRVYGDLSECGFGAFAEFVSVPETALAAMPAAMGFEEAAALPHAALLALQGLRDKGGLRPGQTLLINGAGGGVGTLGVQIAKALGAEGITGVDSAEKAEAMRAAGFTATLDYRREDYTRQDRRHDLILDTKSTRGPFAIARALAPGGTYVTVGGEVPSLLQCLVFGRLVRARTGKTISILDLKPNRGLDDVSALFEAGQLKPVLDGPFSLEQTPEAIRRFGSGAHKGKVIIAVAP